MDTDNRNNIDCPFPAIDMVKTGQNIRELRKKTNTTVEALQNYMGFNAPQAIYKWQRGESLPAIDNMVALSRIFHTSIEDILVVDDDSGMSSRFIGIDCWSRLMVSNRI